MGNRLLQKYSVPGQPGMKPIPQKPVYPPRGGRRIRYQPPSLLAEIPQLLGPAICYQIGHYTGQTLAGMYNLAAGSIGGRLGGVLAYEICKPYFPEQRGHIIAEPQPRFPGPRQPPGPTSGQPPTAFPRQPPERPYQPPGPSGGQPTFNPIGQPSNPIPGYSPNFPYGGDTGGQGPGTISGQPSSPSPGQGPTAPYYLNPIPYCCGFIGPAIVGPMSPHDYDVIFAYGSDLNRKGWAIGPKGVVYNKKTGQPVRIGGGGAGGGVGPSGPSGGGDTGGGEGGTGAPGGTPGGGAFQIRQQKTPIGARPIGTRKNRR